MSRAEWSDTTELITAAISILKHEWPMTIRQLFYQLVVTEIIQNCQRDYRRVSKAMTRARNDGTVLWEWIVDRSRLAYQVAAWHDLAEYSEAVLDSYRRDNWQEQSSYIEVWVEKDAVIGSLRSLCDEWAVSLYPFKGFNSTTCVHDAAERFCEVRRLGGLSCSQKTIDVLYMGDWDPSGECIEAEGQKRIALYYPGQWRITRLAIHKADIAKYHLPPQRVKPTDPRAAGFVRRHGKNTVELDALRPTILRKRLDRAIRRLVEMQAWERALQIEEAQRETTARMARALSNGGQL